MVSQSYPTNITKLIQARGIMPLDSGEADTSVIEHLDGAFLERLFGKEIIVNKTAARLCVAGLWLLYDHLEECHNIAQSIETPDGSYWHAVMHRREGDFSNSKYWYRRLGEHEIFAELVKQSGEITEQNKQLQTVVEDGKWNPFAFVDLCEKASQRGTNIETCRELQQLEWRLLFDHCYRKAVSA
jgi:hypothetical protein